MIKVILWDVDGTLLNFKLAEREAIKACFTQFQLGECSDETVAKYSAINDLHWQMLERKEIEKPRMLVRRFEVFFEELGITTALAAQFNTAYQSCLGDTICFCDDSYNLLQSLRGQVKQYAVTNGTKVAQDKKLNNSGLISLFDGIFISEDVGVEKPDIAFFEHVWQQIGHYEKDEVLIVGDSITSDMQGGNNAGILCCWYNPEGAKNSKRLRIDYEITSLQQIPAILKEQGENA
ncbi:MAG: YjjG family noncanonical pyrimidine nucleotidase [Oscillospiraceae bacterium]|nr:YjjG family noncanonical pyrimidine nucleotidase [Oscillospiraceae bacterium]